MNRQGQEKFGYNSISAPSTPMISSGVNGKKKKSGGFKSFFSLKKSTSNLDNSSSSPERGISKEEGDLPSRRRRHLPGFLHFGGRTSHKDEHKSSEPQSPNENTSQTVEEKKEVHVYHSRVEPPKEETKLSKVDAHGGKIGEKTTLLERVKEDFNKHIHKSPQPKEHQRLEGTSNLGHGNEVVKSGLHQEKKEHSNENAKEEKLATTESEVVMKEHKDPDSPPLVHPHEKESVGCESLAQGLQHMCLPWTIKKEDH